MTDNQAATPQALLTCFRPFGLLPDFSTPPQILMMSEIRIYVACLAAYNNGILHGLHIDATLGESHIWEQTQVMLEASPIEMAEEWAIHDYEGFEGANLSEYASFEHVAALAEFIEEHGNLGGELVSYYGGDLEDAKKRMDEYYGEYSSLEDYARTFTQECGPEIPDSLAYYIDYEAMGRDMGMNGGFISIQTAHDEIHIFGAG